MSSPVEFAGLQTRSLRAIRTPWMMTSERALALTVCALNLIPYLAPLAQPADAFKCMNSGGVYARCRTAPGSRPAQAASCHHSAAAGYVTCDGKDRAFKRNHG